VLGFTAPGPYSIAAAVGQFDLGAVHAMPRAVTLEERMKCLERLYLDLQLSSQREVVYKHRCAILDQVVLGLLVRISEIEQPGTVPEGWNRLRPAKHLDIPAALELARMIADRSNNAALAYIDALRTHAPPPHETSLEIAFARLYPERLVFDASVPPSSQPAMEPSNLSSAGSGHVRESSTEVEPLPEP
jgi:hypothetical protein